MNHPETPFSFSKKKEGQVTDDADFEFQSLPTASMSHSDGDFPASKSSSGLFLLDDPNYVQPNKYDILLTDVTDEFLMTELAGRFQVQHLSQVANWMEETKRYKTDRKVSGKIVGNNKRFMINLPIRLQSKRNDPSNSGTPSPFINVFFLVDTGSPYSFIWDKVMEELCGGNKGKPLPSCVDIELITGNNLEFHLSPHESHFSEINLLGGSALNMADIHSKKRENQFYLEFD